MSGQYLCRQRIGGVQPLPVLRGEHPGRSGHHRVGFGAPSAGQRPVRTQIRVAGAVGQEREFELAPTRQAPQFGGLLSEGMWRRRKRRAGFPSAGVKLGTTVGRAATNPTDRDPIDSGSDDADGRLRSRNAA